MKKTSRILGALAGASALLAACYSLAGLRASRLAESAWREKIERNVPPRDTFDKLLKRDLKTFFLLSSGKSYDIEPALLLDQPTAGKNLPEFFVWVRLLRGKSLVDEGVSTVYGTGRDSFLVSGFLSRKQMLRSPAGAQNFSPAVREALSKYLR